MILPKNARKYINLSLGAPDFQMHDFINRILKETDQTEPGSSRKPNAKKRTDLSLGHPDVKIHDFLIRMLKETNQSEPFEPESSGVRNARLSQ